MEANINCDMGETSKFSSAENDPDLLEIINTANIACGYHAGDEETMRKTIVLAKKNGVSVGAHPSFNDPDNFGRSRITLGKKEVHKLILDQIEIITKIANEENYPITHVKPHGALSNMACEDYDLAYSIGEAIKVFDKNLIYMCNANTQMDKAGDALGLKVAKEIFADRNYNDDGTLVSRKLGHAFVTDPQESLQNILTMLNEKVIKCHSGKKIPCDIHTICIHSDGPTAVAIAKQLKQGLVQAGVKLKPLDLLVQ